MRSMTCQGVAKLLTALLGLILFASAADAGAIVIANKGVGISSMDGATLEKIFLGTTKKLSTGEKVVLGTLKGGPTHEDFLKTYVSKSPAQFLSHWRKLCFSGKAGLPEAFETDADVVAFVAATDGAIAYVADGTPLEGVIQVAVN